MPCVERPPGRPPIVRQGQIASQLHDSKYSPAICQLRAGSRRGSSPPRLLGSVIPFARRDRNSEGPSQGLDPCLAHEPRVADHQPAPRRPDDARMDHHDQLRRKRQQQGDAERLRALRAGQLVWRSDEGEGGRKAPSPCVEAAREAEVVCGLWRVRSINPTSTVRSIHALRLLAVPGQSFAGHKLRRIDVNGDD